MSQRIANSIPFVTGANRGIGAALVDALLARGATKVYAAARDIRTLDSTVASGGGRVIPVALDVTNADAIRAATLRAHDTTLLINNAGVVVSAFRPILDEATIDDLRKELEVNAIAPHAITRAFAPTLIAAKRNGGKSSVVNIASVVSLVSYPMVATYSASKATTHSLTQSWRHALAPHDVDVLGVYPGPVDTDMARDLPIDKTPVQDVANAILDGIEAGDEEIFPDVVAQEQGARYLADPKALERHVSQQMLAMAQEAAVA